MVKKLLGLLDSEPVIVSYVRTPTGRFGKTLSKLKAPELGAIAIKEAIARAGIEPSEVDLVVMGNVIQAGIGQNPARQAAIEAGVPENVDSYTVNMVCSSGMQAIINACQAIAAGDANVVVAGGMESMSNSPLLIPSKVRWGFKFSYNIPALPIIDSVTHDGLMDFKDSLSMGEIAERIAKAKGVTRREADEFAYNSHMKASDATRKGYFERELAHVDLVKDGYRIALSEDETVRPDTDVEKLSKLPPAFDGCDIMTAGNSPPMSDGASALVITSRRKCTSLKIEPVAKVLGYSWGAYDRLNFVEAPVPVTKKLLERLDLRISDFDLIEHNEAFAVASIIVARELGIDYDRLNIFGGAVALGHPIGSSGARIVVTLLNALNVKGMKRGLATICHGGGGATSIAVELLK